MLKASDDCRKQADESPDQSMSFLLVQRCW